MLTWTTYGSWLQGDKRGFVKGGKILSGNKVLESINKTKQKAKKVRLSKKDIEIIENALLKKTKQLNQKVYALAVCKNHIHLVLENIELAIGNVVIHYKRACKAALAKNGFKGKAWTGGYDKRYIYEQKSLDKRINYVKRHK